MEDILYTVKEVAKLLKVNTSTVYKLFDDEELPLPHLNLGSKKVRKVALEQYLEERERRTMENEQVS